MTIEERINSELTRLSTEKPDIYAIASKLNETFDELIGKVKDHLREISREMPEYDKHDDSHSEAVLCIIEALLQAQHIQELTLLEAMLLRFCCYFHDTGMILPEFCKPLLEKVEADPKADPVDSLEAWLVKNEKGFEQVKELFLVPSTRDDYLDFLIKELEAYRDERLGLEPAPDDMKPSDYIKTTRHDYLRRNHGERAKTYAANLSRFFTDIISGGETELAECVGNICAAHSWEIQKVRELPIRLELFLNCPEMTCNIRYLAMLLRMGDLLHFGPERASRTLYIEREKMGPESDLHWLAKQGERGYLISRNSAGGVDIAYYGSFKVPKEYYFVQGHMNWVNEELCCYEAFRRQMEVQKEERQYDLGLPEKVNRDHLGTQGFTPDRDLKFKLEHRNIIELLMGARLYRDEFMCLRELYQNALDACRCMRAEQPGLETEIEFGLGTDGSGDYLYCKDQGTGMTMDIVKNYLLRIGNSYYKSDEFRRKNAHWDKAVAPVSEFGIGLLSCYMIADRIDIITRHYTTVEGEKPIWISMSDSDDFGYRRETKRLQERQLGKHGTMVKLYLKEEYKSMVTGYLPEELRDAAFLLDRYDPQEDTKLAPEAQAYLEQFENSLYHRVQQFVHIPEEGIPVWIRRENRRQKLLRADERYDLIGRIPNLTQHGFSADWLLDKMYGNLTWRHTNWGKLDASVYLPVLEAGDAAFESYHCNVWDEESGASASAILRLPSAVQEKDVMKDVMTVLSRYTGTDIANDGIVYIDGMPVPDDAWKGAIRYSFWGAIRPRLSVDRGAIREVPDRVQEIRETLEEKLRRELARTIRQHVDRYPAVQTQEFWGHVRDNLLGRFSRDLVLELIRDLSGDVMRDCVVLDATLYDWFHGEGLSLNVRALEAGTGFSSYVLKRILLRAESVRIKDGRLIIRKGANWDLSDRERQNLELTERRIGNTLAWVQDLPKKYVGYDSVGAYPGLIPKRTWLRLKDRGKWSDRLYYAANRSPLHGNQDPLWLEEPDWRDVQMFLRESPDSHSLYQCNADIKFEEDGCRRYVAYVFVSPRELNAKEKAKLERYRVIPEYIRGVREGWSILYYSYMNGYVIAPGIVEREKMLKLLPKEALEHDDGLEYYFTDGTRAF